MMDAAALETNICAVASEKDKTHTKKIKDRARVP